MSSVRTPGYSALAPVQYLTSGKNRFLTVLASLVALEQSAEDECWRAALEDVNWVLEEVRAAAEASKTK